MFSCSTCRTIVSTVQSRDATMIPYLLGCVGRSSSDASSLFHNSTSSSCSESTLAFMDSPFSHSFQVGKLLKNQYPKVPRWVGRRDRLDLRVVALEYAWRSPH